VMRLNRQAAPEKYDRITALLGHDAADAAAQLLEDLRLPTTFRSAGLRKEDFDVIVAESMPSGSLKANPKKVTEADLLAILSAVS
jgi:alcohol dehydrogenase class IV